MNDDRAHWVRQNAPIFSLMAVFALLAGTYSIVTPLFEMSDELWHYPMVKTLADGNGLPVQDPANPGPWRQEGSQPPLYYALGALLTFWIDTSDVGEVLRPNPHVDNGVITADGNTNLIVHNYAREAEFPWRGTVLAVHLVRLMSVVMSTTAIYFTYRIGQEVFPERDWLALAAAGAVAFTPMFTFISGAVNNDNLAVLLAALGLWLMMRIVRAADADQATLRLAILLGLVLGASALTKASVLGQFGLAGLTMAYAAVKKRRWQTFFLEGPLIIALAAAIAGWWYWRNWVLYGDPFGLNIFIEILGRRQRPASLLQLWTERHGFMQSYWGLFGGVNVPMTGWVYAVLNTLFVAGWLGVPLMLIQKFKRDKFQLEALMPTLLSLLWIAGVIAPLASYWARITWSSQGRLVFSAIMSINLWMIAGLSGWLPDKWGRWTAAAVIGFMGVISAAAPFLYIRPAYLPPPQAENVSVDAPAAAFTPPGTTEPALRLLNYDFDAAEVRPGESVEVSLVWESTAAMDRRWSVFIHLQDSDGFLAGQRDTYPGLGLIATTDISPGRRWVDRYVVPISGSAYAPDQLTVLVGVYDFVTGERMTLAQGMQTSLALGEVDLRSRASERGLPNPTAINFGNQVSLMGYTLDARTSTPGQTLALTVYWQALAPLTTNYTISAQVLGPQTQRYAAVDQWPQGGAMPTAAWPPGEVIEDTYVLTLAADTPPGEYPIQIVVYSQDEAGEIARLPIILEDGRLTDDFVFLTRVRVVPGEKTP